MLPPARARSSKACHSDERVSLYEQAGREETLLWNRGQLPQIVVKVALTAVCCLCCCCCCFYCLSFGTNSFGNGINNFALALVTVDFRSSVGCYGAAALRLLLLRESVGRLGFQYSVASVR